MPSLRASSILRADSSAVRMASRLSKEMTMLDMAAPFLSAFQQRALHGRLRRKPQGAGGAQAPLDAMNFP